MEFDAEADLSANKNSLVIMPDEMSYYGEAFRTAVSELANGKAAALEQGNSMWVFLRRPASEVKTLSELAASYDLPRLIKNEDFTNQLIAAGAAMENHLDQSAMNAYKAEKVKLS